MKNIAKCKNLSLLKLTCPNPRNNDTKHDIINPLIFNKSK